MRPQQIPLKLLIAGISTIFVSVVMAGVVIVWLRTPNSRTNVVPNREAESVQWNLREFRDHIQRNEFDLPCRERGRSLYFTTKDNIEFVGTCLGNDATWELTRPRHDVTRVTQHDDPQAARDAVGRSNLYAVHWGRFSIECGLKSRVEQAATALGIPQSRVSVPSADPAELDRPTFAEGLMNLVEKLEREEQQQQKAGGK